MTSLNGMAERLRAQLASSRGIELPGCYDALSAMMLERAQFECVFLSGYGVAASYLGNPDIGLTTLCETVSVTRNVVSRVGVPVVVDADNGYGNEDNVVRVVRELEAAGAAAVVLEDQVFPKRCGHSEGKKVIPLPEYMRKLDAALAARRTPLVVIARTDAPDLDEALSRAKAFRAAGADVTLVDGLRSLPDLQRVAAEVPGPKQVNLIYGGKTPLMSAPALYELGFKIVLYSTPALYVAMHAMAEAMATLQRTHDLGSIASASASFAQVQDLLESRYCASIPGAKERRA